jgi:WD40 repeat protein
MSEAAAKLFAEIGREHLFEAPVTAVHWLGERAAFALGDGTIRLARADMGETAVVEAHKGAILSACAGPKGTSLVSGGDDGRVVETLGHGEAREISSAGKKWIDHVAAAPWGGIAWTAGRTVEVDTAKKDKRITAQMASSCGAIAFAPKGQRLAVAHYGGATILGLAYEASQATALLWKGSHIGITWSPDARFLVSVTQENALHVWRLGDGTDAQMSGYPAKPRSLSWSRKGDWLATSGGNGALVWPFKGKDGPMGQQATELAPRPHIATCVAWHPASVTLAAAFRNGEIAFARLADKGVLAVRPADGRSIGHLAWGAGGRHLAFGGEDGLAGVIDTARWQQ